MLNKEEKLLYSLSALKEVIETWDIDVEVTLTKDGNKHTINAYKEIEKCVVDYVNSLQPYEFEDLKVGMWVYDSKLNKCNLIVEILDNEILGFYYIMDNVLRYRNAYEENRFFPVQMANVGCE